MNMSKQKKGITLIELMMTIVLFIILIGSFLWIFTTGLKVWHFGIERADIRQGGTAAIERMVRELTQAGSFTIAQATQIKFAADLDNDGSDEAITFDVDGSDLREDVDGKDTVLTSNVNSLIFSYRDLNDAEMEFPITGGNQDNIRVITIFLTLSEAYETITLSSSAYARNQGL